MEGAPDPQRLSRKGNTCGEDGGECGDVGEKGWRRRQEVYYRMPSFAALPHSLPSLPCVSPYPSGRRGPCAPSLIGEFFSVEKHFIFVNVYGDGYGGFLEVGLVGNGSAMVEMEGEKEIGTKEAQKSREERRSGGETV